eukprot:Skav214709  [mRNA]  locus=scaffold331:355866:356303:- [translate_table: standard]
MFLFQGCSDAKLRLGTFLTLVVWISIACLIIVALCISRRSLGDISVKIEIAGLILCLVSHGMMIYENAETTFVEDKDDEISLWLWAFAHMFQSIGYFHLVQGEIRKCRLSEKAGIWLLLSGSVLDQYSARMYASPVHDGYIYKIP